VNYRVKLNMALVGALALWTVFLVSGRRWIQSHPATAEQLRSASPCLGRAQRVLLPGFPAKHDLAANYWIGNDDLDWTAGDSKAAQKQEVLYRYTACAIATGDRVIISETRALPQVDAGSGRIAFPLLLPSDLRLAATINAGSRIDVWEDPRSVATGIIVLAVQCRYNTLPETDCSAILDAAPEDVSRLQKANPKSIAIIVRAPKSKEK